MRCAQRVSLGKAKSKLFLDQNKTLGKVNFDLIVSTIPSIKGYFYGALVLDDHTAYIWLYGLKTKVEALDTAKKWMAEIADLREKHPRLVVMRDNAKENRSKAICDYFTSTGVGKQIGGGIDHVDFHASQVWHR
jgi:hypothetical protein